MPFCCDVSEDPATAVAYALANDKQLQQKPSDHLQSRSLCDRFTYLSDLKSAFSLKPLRCLGSFRWSIPLMFASFTLVSVWYIAVPFWVDRDAMAYKYAFEPRSVHSYSAWGTAMLVLVPLLLLFTGSSLCAGGDRFSRWTLYVVSAAYLVLIIVGNALGSSETKMRLASEQEFAVQFNEFYCNSLTFRVCLKGSEDDMLKLMGGNNSTLTAAGANATTTAPEIAAEIRTRCQKLILDEIARTYDNQRDTYGGKPDAYLPSEMFLDDCNMPSNVNAWCGDLLSATSPLTDADHRTLPAPYAANPEMFLSYTREWTKRMAMSNALLGSAAGCMTLAAWSLKVRQVSEQHGW